MERLKYISLVTELRQIAVARAMSLLDGKDDAEDVAGESKVENKENRRGPALSPLWTRSHYQGQNRLRLLPLERRLHLPRTFHIVAGFYPSHAIDDANIGHRHLTVTVGIGVTFITTVPSRFE